MGNPLATSSVGGILFTNTRVSNSIAGISSDRNNTWDGWLWKFDTPQTKIYNKKITITIRVRVNS
jgi:hypothetical protein